MEAIVEELEQEKTALMDMKQFMIKLLQLMQDSSDAFEDADTEYERAVINLGQGN